MPIPTDGKGTAFIQALIRELRGVKEIMPNQEPESRYSRYSREELEKLLERGLSSHEQKLILDELSNRFTQELLDKVGLKKAQEKSVSPTKLPVAKAKAQEKQKPLPAPSVNKYPQPKPPESSPSIPKKPRTELESTRDQSNVLRKIVSFIAIGLSLWGCLILAISIIGTIPEVRCFLGFSSELCLSQRNGLELKSEKGVDYTKLRDLLAEGRWKEADQETSDRMLEAMGKNSWGDVDSSDIGNFPCEDLSTIDQLWVKYSNGRFGFSVQKDIWLEVGGKDDDTDEKLYDTAKKLEDRFGWSKGGEDIDYDSLQFNLSAPPGHLPRGGLVDGVIDWYLGGSSYKSEFLAQRTATCSEIGTNEQD